MTLRRTQELDIPELVPGWHQPAVLDPGDVIDAQLTVPVAEDLMADAEDDVSGPGTTDDIVDSAVDAGVGPVRGTETAYIRLEEIVDDEHQFDVALAGFTQPLADVVCRSNCLRCIRN